MSSYVPEYEIYGTKGRYWVREANNPPSRPGRPEPTLPSPFRYGPFRSIRTSRRVAAKLAKERLRRYQEHHIETVRAPLD